MKGLGVLLRRAVFVLRRGTNRVVSCLAGIVAHAEAARPTVVMARDGESSLGPRVAVFCHWDRQGRIAEHVRMYIKALRAEGFSIVFVTNSRNITNENLAWAGTVSAKIIVRRNLGFDFGAWRDGLRECALPQPETAQILLVNDSVYGPFWPLASIFRRTAEQDVVWGLTDSWQRRYHLQSYFLVVGPAAFRNPAWQRFWNNVLPVRSKSYVIDKYEIGLTQFFLRNGISCRALWPYEQLLDVVRNHSCQETDEAAVDPLSQKAAEARHRVLQAMAAQCAMNPTADLWSTLLDLGFPFLKRELVRFNPGCVPDVSLWRPVLQVLAPLEAEVIRQDLMLKLRNRTP